MPQQRVLNWRPSLPDARDLEYAHVELKAFEATLPPKVDLRPQMSPVKDQGTMGSCSGHAAASGAEFLQLLELRTNFPDQENMVYLIDKFTPVSRMFIYWNERVLEGTTGSDAGVTTMRSACKTLIKEGAARESLWPYKAENLLKAPPPAAYADGKLHQVAVYYKLTGMTQLKRCLANGFPFLFGVSVYTSFLSDETAQTGVIPMPGSNESLEGGHALICCGYDDSKAMFIFKNSWGTSWGDKGYGYLPYAYMNSRLADDFYTLRRQFGK